MKFTENLVKWANHTREGFADQSLEEAISTRRLLDICSAFKIFGNKTQAITLCINRFSENVRTALFEFYTKIDEQIEPVNGPNLGVTDKWKEEDETPF